MINFFAIIKDLKDRKRKKEAKEKKKVPLLFLSSRRHLSPGVITEIAKSIVIKNERLLMASFPFG